MGKQHLNTRPTTHPINSSEGEQTRIVEHLPQREKAAAQEVGIELFEFERNTAEIEGYEWLPEFTEDHPLVGTTQRLMQLNQFEELPVPGKTLSRRFMYLWRTVSETTRLDVQAGRKRAITKDDVIGVLEVLDTFQAWVEDYYHLKAHKRSQAASPIASCFS